MRAQMKLSENDKENIRDMEGINEMQTCELINAIKEEVHDDITLVKHPENEKENITDMENTDKLQMETCETTHKMKEEVVFIWNTEDKVENNAINDTDTEYKVHVNVMDGIVEGDGLDNESDDKNKEYVNAINDVDELHETNNVSCDDRENDKDIDESSLTGDYVRRSDQDLHISEEGNAVNNNVDNSENNADRLEKSRSSLRKLQDSNHDKSAGFQTSDNTMNLQVSYICKCQDTFTMYSDLRKHACKMKRSSDDERKEEGINEKAIHVQDSNPGNSAGFETSVKSVDLQVCYVCQCERMFVTLSDLSNHVCTTPRKKRETSHQQDAREGRIALLPL